MAQKHAAFAALCTAKMIHGRVALVLIPMCGVAAVDCVAEQVDDTTSTVMLDTSGGAWITPAPGTLQGEDVTRRCRHAVTSVGPFVFIYGGLKGSTLLDDLLLAGASHTALVLWTALLRGWV